ncbi:acetylornithine aminotransferase, partial [Burkholderia multivorans]
SKVMVVSASERPGVDLDYTFAQVEITEATVDYSGNCGNLSSGVVPFGLLAGLIDAGDGWHVFRLFNTNTGKLVDVGLTVEGGQAAVD